MLVDSACSISWSMEKVLYTVLQVLLKVLCIRSFNSNLAWQSGCLDLKRVILIHQRRAVMEEVPTHRYLQDDKGIISSWKIVHDHPLAGRWKDIPRCCVTGGDADSHQEWPQFTLAVR